MRFNLEKTSERISRTREVVLLNDSSSTVSHSGIRTCPGIYYETLRGVSYIYGCLFGNAGHVLHSVWSLDYKMDACLCIYYVYSCSERMLKTKTYLKIVTPLKGSFITGFSCEMSATNKCTMSATFL